MELAARIRQLKWNLRHGAMLQNRERKDPGLWKKLKWWEKDILKEYKDGTLKRKVNAAVRDLRRRRLRGEDAGDYEDNRQQQDNAEVNITPDGKRRRVDTSRFEFAD